MKVGEEYAAGSVPGFRSRYRIIEEAGDISVMAQPLDFYGSVSGSPLLVNRQAFTATWAEEAAERELKRVARLDEVAEEKIKQAEQAKQRTQRENAMQQVLPAFYGIKSGAYPLTDLISAAVFRGAHEMYVSLDAILELGNRIKALTIERQGATWVSP
jgi:hypothetical protein